MKKSILFSIIVFISLQLLGQNHRSNCPVKEEKFTRTNPDGSSLTLRVSGNELVQYFETNEGYTVLQNKNGYFEYAEKDAQQNLVGSGIIARDENSNIPGFVYHI